MELNLESFKKSITSLDAVLKKATDDKFMSSLDSVTRYAIRSGVIKNFEFTYELAWKFLKRWLKNNVTSEEIEGINRRELFRLSAENLLISDVNQWVLYHEARNETSHTYEVTTADRVFNISILFLEDAKKLLANLEKHNA